MSSSSSPGSGSHSKCEAGRPHRRRRLGEQHSRLGLAFEECEVKTDVRASVATWASLRLEMPARSGSPSLLTRRKNWTLKPRLSGNVARGRTRNVTNPDWSVACSGGVDVTRGVERTNTSAPRTTNARVSETWTRIEIG